MSENKNNNEKDFHRGHRERLRKRYLENGIDSLAEHEILEIILFYSTPRVDTKPLAHKLIDKYGSLKNVIGALYESLIENGLTSSGAVHIKLFYDVNNWIRRKELVGSKKTDYSEIGKAFVEELSGDSTERLSMLMLDSKNKVLGIETVCRGSFKSAAVNMRVIADNCLKRNAAKVILAHNHPSGDLNGSTEDHIATAMVENFLSYIGVELAEHYIIAGGTYIGIKSRQAEIKKQEEILHKSGFGFEREIE